MALIIATFDSTEKTLSVTIDGTLVTDVIGFSSSQNYSYDGGDEDEFSCDVMTKTVDDEAGTRTYTHICAKDNAPSGAKATKFPGLVEVVSSEPPPSKAVSDAAKFLCG